MTPPRRNVRILSGVRTRWTLAIYAAGCLASLAGYFARSRSEGAKVNVGGMIDQFYNPKRRLAQPTDRFSGELVVLSSVLSVCISLWLGSREQGRELRPDPRRIVLGCVIGILGSLLREYSMMSLGPASSFYAEAGDNHKLVLTGPYRYVRHPAYLGAHLRGLGATIPSESNPALAWSCAVLLIGRVPRIIVEERLLSRRYPVEYAQYRAETGALIPKFSMNLTRQHKRIVSRLLRNVESASVAGDPAQLEGRA